MSWTRPEGDERSEDRKGNYSLVGLWLRRLGETYLGAWLIDLFQSSSQAMATASSGPGIATTGAGGGPLSFMGCMREASPPPFDEPPPHYQQHHHHHHHHQRPVGLPTGEFNQLAHGFDSMPKEPKKRRFHPLRGLRRIFRRKSRGAADARPNGTGNGGPAGERELGAEHAVRDREEVTLSDPAGRADEIRSRSASELLTDDRDRLFVRRRGVEESFANLQRAGGAGQLSVSHDSVFPGEVSHARPLSSLEMHASLERRTAKASNNDTDHKDSHTAQRHRISLRVLEQIKTVIESRNQIAAASGSTTAAAATTTATTTTTTEAANSLHSRFSRDRSASAAEDAQAKVPRKDAPMPTNVPSGEAPRSPLKEDLPELTTGSLNHTAALHRMAVRPKNRRPPRRSTSQSNGLSSSNGLTRIDSISELSVDTMDSLEGTAADNSIGSINMPESPAQELPPPSPPLSLPVPTMWQEPQEQQPEPKQEHKQEPKQEQKQEQKPEQKPEQKQASKPIPILRKSSSRLSRKSDVFEELEAKLRKPAVSPDSLESNLDSRSSGDNLDAPEESPMSRMPPKPSPRATGASAGSPRRRSSSNRLSKSPDSLESSCSPGWLSKSTEGFDKLSDAEPGRPVAAQRRLLSPTISKSQERVCSAKSADSLDALENLYSDGSMERRRSSFEIRPRRPQPHHRLMSKSTDCFEEQQHAEIEERRKRVSLSEVNLSRNSYSSKLLSKSSESFEKIASPTEKSAEGEKSAGYWRSSRRTAHSSESSDNLELEDNCKLENRKARRSSSKRLSAGNGNGYLDELEAAVLRKPSPRLQKSSESSELGSTDTLDSDRRNTMKSSDSDETLDSLEKELQTEPEQERQEEEVSEPPVETREKLVEDEDDKSAFSWRRRTNSQESKGSPNNMDILLAYSLVSRIQENGNGDVNNEDDGQREEDRSSKITASPVVVYPKKKQHQQSPQSSSEDNKTLSLLSNNKTDEDLQNIINGNISVVSNDNKSFKEKLIMFEKLGK